MSTSHCGSVVVKVPLEMTSPVIISSMVSLVSGAGWDVSGLCQTLNRAKLGTCALWILPLSRRKILAALEIEALGSGKLSPGSRGTPGACRNTSGRSVNRGPARQSPASTRRVERVPRRAQRLHTLPHRRSGTATSSPAIGTPGPAAAAAAPDCLYTIQRAKACKGVPAAQAALVSRTAAMDEAKDDGVEEIDAKAFEENQDDEAPIDDFGRRARANVSVRRPVVDGVVDDAKVPIPNSFHRTVVHYPGCVMFTTGLIALILAGLAFGAGESELGGSFTDISNIKVQRLYGFFAFRQDYWKATDKDWRRRLSSDFGRTRSPSISKAALARIPVKPTTQSRKESSGAASTPTKIRDRPRRA